MADNLVVIIPTSGRSELLKRTLESLNNCVKPKIYKETIVVENGIKGGAEEISRIFKKDLSLKYVHNDIPNKSNALNNVIQSVKNSLIFFTDDDVRLDAKILEAYTLASANTSSGVFYGGPYGVDYVSKPPMWLVEYLPKSAVGWDFGDKAVCIDKDNTFIGFNWAAFANDLIRLGGFNVNFGPGSKTNATGQETEMQWRLLENGVKGCYVPGAKVWHFVPPKRCDQKFASTRVYRWGISQGLICKGDIVLIIATWLRSGVKAIGWKFNKDCSKNVKQYFRFIYYTGLIKGTLLNKWNTYRG